jgi:AcrR family transcriptional regulator
MRAPSSIATAREPRRRRGQLRVAALLDAAAATFIEQGYEASTMTEIARRAGAAIGSLYQFFPSKESLAVALISRYGERLEARLGELAARARGMTPRAFADALVDLRLELRAQRDATLALSDAPGTAGERARFRQSMRDHVSAGLRAVRPRLSPARARAMAIVILNALKMLPALIDEEPQVKLKLVPELRALLAAYLGAPAEPGPARRPLGT